LIFFAARYLRGHAHEHFLRNLHCRSGRSRSHPSLRKRTRATGGLILLDRHGNPGFAFNTPRMAYGFVAPDGSFVTSV